MTLPEFSILYAPQLRLLFGPPMRLLRGQESGRSRLKASAARIILVAIALAILVVLIGIVALKAFSRSSGPSYEGRSLASWLEGFGPRPIGGGLMHDRLSRMVMVTNRAATAAAIRAMGTNALPELLRRLQTRDEPGWERDAREFLAEHRIRWFSSTDPQTIREQAALAVYYLGPRAATALHTLQRLLHQYAFSVAATHALAGLGTQSIPALSTGLTNLSNPWIADCAVWGLAQAGTNAAPAVPAILPLLKRPGAADVQITIWALGEIREPANIIIPAITALLTNSDPGIRQFSTNALKRLEKTDH